MGLTVLRLLATHRFKKSIQQDPGTYHDKISKPRLTHASQTMVTYYFSGITQSLIHVVSKQYIPFIPT
jgi:hypothetical protein